MKTRLIILAAGNGRRMASEVPKVLIPVGTRPMIGHLLDAVKKSGVDPRPLVVVGKNGEAVRGELGGGVDYVMQEEQLGTGHAVLAAEKLLRGAADAIMVLYGDHPNLRAETIKKIISVHAARVPEITMAITQVPDFEEWRKPLADFGRIVRGSEGEIRAIVEKKDATTDQLVIAELNPSFFCFNAAWLWDNLKKIGNRNAQKEYYLTDLVQIAIDQGKRVETVEVDPIETLGVNTPEHLELVRGLVR